MGPEIDRNAFYFVYMAIGGLGSWFTATAGFVHTGAQITRRIKQKYLEAVLRQNMAVFDATGTGEILSRLNADSNSIQDALSSKLSLAISAMGTLVVTITVCFVLGWLLTFILLWSFILGGAILYLGGKATVQYSTSSLAESSAGTSIVEEALGAIKGTTALGMQKRSLELYKPR